MIYVVRGQLSQIEQQIDTHFLDMKISLTFVVILDMVCGRWAGNQSYYDNISRIKI